MQSAGILSESFWASICATRPDLERLLHQRMQSLIAAAADRTHLVRWTLAGANPLIAGAAAAWLDKAV